MSSYGQTIPPKWFLTQSPQQFTKAAFAAYLCRALVTVGMQEIKSLSPPWDFNDPTQDNVVRTNGSAWVWWFDFPSTETFSVGGHTYRPVLAVYAPLYDYGSSGPNNIVADILPMQLFYRRSDRVDLDDFLSYTRTSIDGTFYGLGGLGSGINPVYAGQEGAFVQLWNWILWTGWSSVYRTQLLGTHNFHVFLGHGGLLVQIGSGTSKSDNNDIMSFMVAFGGARVPGQARIPMDDPNLNRINPTFALPLKSTSDQYYYAATFSWTFGSITSVRPMSWSLGMQHDRKFTLNPVRLQIFNQENIQRPIVPVADADTKASPRTLTEGGAHVLIALVYITWDRALSSPIDYYGPLDPTIRAEPVPAWADVWTTPMAAFTDKTAPIGEYLDPTPSSPGPVGTHWFLFHAAGINSMMAANCEGVTKLSAFVNPGGTQLNDQHLDFAPGGLSGPFTPTTDITQDGGYVATSSVDEVLNDYAYATDQSLYFHIHTPTITADQYFEMTLELFNRADTARTPGTGSDPVLLYYSLDGTTWQLVGTGAQAQGVNQYENAGTDSGQPYYNYTPVTRFRLPQAPDGKIWFRFRHYFSTFFDTRHLGVRNVHLFTMQRS